MNDIKPIIERLESQCLRAEHCISEGNQTQFMEQLRNLLTTPESPILLNEFERRFRPEGNYVQNINSLSETLRGIQSSFFGVTGTNYFIHFISNSPFPGHLFDRTDERKCRIHYQEDGALFSLQILEDHQELEDDHQELDNPRFHFSAPRPLLDEVFHGGRTILDEKGRHFSVIKISTTINEINRNLTLKLDNKWLERARLRH